MATKFYEKYFSIRFPNYEYRDKMWIPVVEYLQRYIPENSVVLDVGAGYCNFINHVVAKEKHASDFADVVKEYAGPGVITHVEDCTKLTHKDNTFDIVFESNTFEHLDYDQSHKAAQEIFRVLKPGGKFIAMQPNFRYFSKYYFDDYTHRQPFSHVSFPAMLENYGFEIEKVVPKFLPATFKQRLPRIPFLVRLYLMSPWHPRAGQMLVVAKKPLAK